MAESPNRVLIRFLYNAHEHGMTSSPLGSYQEIDFLPGESAVRQRMGDYHSVLLIKQLDGYEADWLAKYAAGHAMEYDGTTVYIHRVKYQDACAELTSLAKAYADWQAHKRTPQPKYPGNTADSTD